MQSASPKPRSTKNMALLCTKRAKSALVGGFGPGMLNRRACSNKCDGCAEWRAPRRSQGVGWVWGGESRSRRTFSIAITPAISALKSDQYLQGERRRGVSCCNRTGGGHAQAHAEFGAREVAACRRAGRDGGSLPALDAQHPSALCVAGLMLLFMNSNSKFQF